MHPAGVAVGLTGRMVLRPGERGSCRMSHATRDMLIIPPMSAAADRRMNATTQWWRDWSAQCNLEGEHWPMALRSALALKPLTYGLSGAVLAAATTSLPEAIGGGRNYDYRFCWLRMPARVLLPVRVLSRRSGPKRCSWHGSKRRSRRVNCASPARLGPWRRPQRLPSALAPCAASAGLSTASAPSPALIRC